MALSSTRDVKVRYYSGPERRLANQPRRKIQHRRHRLRTEALISDCRSGKHRRVEDDEGFITIASLYSEKTHPQNIK
ncbi:MAG: hypothetical protein ACN4GM_12410 [Gammaproteobacteria bacterium]